MVGALDRGVEQDPPAGVAETQAEFDVLNAGALVRVGVEAAQIQKGLPPHGAAAGPEGGGWARVAAVGVVVQQVAEAAHHAGGGGAIVVAAKHRRQLGVCVEMGPEPFHGVRVELHIRIHEKQDVASGLLGRPVAGGGGGGVEHHQGFIPRLPAGQGGADAGAEGLLPADGGHHQGEGGWAMGERSHGVRPLAVWL